MKYLKKPGRKFIVLVPETDTEKSEIRELLHIENALAQVREDVGLKMLEQGQEKGQRYQGLLPLHLANNASGQIWALFEVLVHDEQWEITHEVTVICPDDDALKEWYRSLDAYIDSA